VEHYSDFYRRAFVVATVVVLGYALIRILNPFWAALEWAVVLAFLLHPLQRRLTGRLAGRAGLSALIITALTPLVIIAPLSAVGLAFARQVGNLIGYLRTRSAVPFPALVYRFEHERLIHPLVRWAQRTLAVSMHQMELWIEAGARSALQSAAAASGSVMLGLAGTLASFLLMLFLLFFLLRDGSVMLETLTRLIPLDGARRAAIVRDVIAALRAVVFGTAATAVIQGTLIGVGFAIAGLPYPVVLGALAVFAAFIPAVGTAVVLVPAIVYLAIIAHWGATVFLTIWSLLIVTAEQFLRPMISAHHGSVPTLAVFVGAIGGVEVFGLLGIVIGPVLLALIAELIRIAEQSVARQ
jgi:predicted PurR-regulated permease PerM